MLFLIKNKILLVENVLKIILFAYYYKKNTWETKKKLFPKSGAPYIKKARLPTRVLKNKRAYSDGGINKNRRAYSNSGINLEE